MGTSSIKIEKRGKRAILRLKYEPDTDEVAPNDYVVRYQKSGTSEWKEWTKGARLDAEGNYLRDGYPPIEFVAGEYSLEEGQPGTAGLPGDHPPYEEGNYTIAVRWTRDGTETGFGSTTTLDIGGCFIATAAYGSETADEVQFLRELRDDVLRSTRWGTDFFDAFWAHYYRLSPPIAEQLRADPALKELVRWSIVAPWVSYMRLVVSQPRWDERAGEIEALSPDLRSFVERARAGIDEWLKEVELPRDFAGREPDEALRELNVILDFGRRSGTLEYLDDLVRSGDLPLRFDSDDEPRLVDELAAAGRSPAEIERILHGS